METNNQNGQICPKTWMVESILVTIFCCLPLGIVGIFNANKVEERYRNGDLQGAQQASDNAKQFMLIGAIVGIIFEIIGFATGFLSALLGI